MDAAFGSSSSTVSAYKGSYDQWEREYQAYNKALREFNSALEAHNTRRLQRIGGWRLPPTPDVPPSEVKAPKSVWDTAPAGVLPREALTAFTVDGLLSARECEALRETAEAVGFRTLVSRLSRAERSNTRIILNDKPLADRLFRQVRHLLPRVMKTRDGERVPYGISEQVRLCRYLAGEHFSAHKDDIYRNRDATLQSTLTMVIYLNDDFSGGHLNFLRHKSSSSERDNVLASVTPTTGTAAIFDQQLIHEGERLERGTKWLLRCDIAYILKGVNPKSVHTHRAV